MVGLGDVQHVDASLLEPLGELRGVTQVDAALAALGRHDGELVIDDHIGHGLAQSTDEHEGETRAVLERAAELVGAVIHAGGAQAAGQAVAVNLDDVDAGFLGTAGAVAHLVDDLEQALLAHLIGEVHHVVMQALADLGHLALLEELVDGVAIVLGMEDLHAELAAVLMHGVGELLERVDLLIAVELGRGRERGDGRDVAQHDVGRATLCDAGVEAAAALANAAVALLIAGSQRREHDAVLELDTTDGDGIENPHIRLGHIRPSPFITTRRSDATRLLET